MSRLILFALLSVLFIEPNIIRAGEKIIIDSEMTLEEAVAGTKAPKDVLDNIVLINVEYYSFDNKLHKGQIAAHKDLEKDIISLFQIIKAEKFPVGKAVPIVKYNWSDSASMEDNNTSAFNYRTIAGTDRLSNHALGKALDINPFKNPVVYKDGKTTPSKAVYKPGNPGVFSAAHKLVLEMKKMGWRWGGDFNSYKDNHHFDKE